jgi:hypothetical protein
VIRAIGSLRRVERSVVGGPTRRADAAEPVFV